MSKTNRSMKKPKVSIIVPVYNPGKYFKKCLDTLVQQTLKDIEIILVLDCPTDGSEKIAEQFFAQDDRIRLVYNEQNLHTGLSRNAGLEIATGEYVGFCDSDDYCDVEKYDKLYSKAITENYDMVCCHFYIQKDNLISKVIMPKEPDSKEDLKFFLIENFLKRNVGFGTNCRWIYRAEMIKQNALKFEDSKATSGEDGLFTLESTLISNNIGFISDFLFYYNIHSQSISHSKFSASNHLSTKSNIAFCKKIFSLLNLYNVEEKYYSALLEGIPKFLYSGFYNGFRDSFKTGLKGFCLISKNKTFAKLFSNLFNRKNIPILFQLKSTVILFVIIVRMSHFFHFDNN